MFATTKQQVNLLQHISNDTSRSIVECGTNTYRFDDDSTGGCPFCNHHDCFKMFFDENDPEVATYCCFSCGERGDVITWHAKRKELTPAEAVRDLAKIYDISIPTNYNPIQDLFNLAADYYHNCLMDACDRPQTILNRMTPKQYQLEVRKHKEDTLKRFKVGWSDGGLVHYLEGLGFEQELLVDSGLASRRTGRDFFPANVFIYPHTVDGKVSHVTFKDPSKRLAYQLPNKAVLNNHEFYGQDTIKDKAVVFLVEGENDLLSMYEAEDFPHDAGVLATIGSISGEQLKWVEDKLAGKSVITLFDPDEAGNKYREKTTRVVKTVEKLVQYIPPNDQDIDEYLKSGKTLTELLEKETPIQSAAKAPSATDLLARLNSGFGAEAVDGIEGDIELSSEDSNDLTVIAKGGCYFKMKYDKEGMPNFMRISDFVLEVLSVFIRDDGERIREVVLHKQGGTTFGPFYVTSANKVNVQSFRNLVANVADAAFKGGENELADVWSLIMLKNKIKEAKEVRVVGWNDEVNAWVFRNMVLTKSGEEVKPDEKGIFWLEGGQKGIRPASINETTTDGSDIPYLETSLSMEESRELLGNVLDNLFKNLNSLGTALMMVGWTKAVMYSNWIHSNKTFPFIYLWGSKGEGKSTVVKWLQQFYGVGESGCTAVKMLGSAVSFIRRSAYYSSLPMIVDELRSDNETEKYYSLFRSLFDRTGRTISGGDGFSVKTQQTRACFAFAGEDAIHDPALNERALSLRIPVFGRETKETYAWMEANKHLFTNITYYWLKEALAKDVDELRMEISDYEKALVEQGCTKRNSKNWASVAYFAERISAEYYPDFDFRKYVLEAASDAAKVQREESTVANFFQQVEMLRGEEDSPVTNEVMQVSGNKLHIWFMQLFRLVSKDSRQGFPFSKKAVMSAIMDEPYYVAGPENNRIQMGLDGEKRSVVTLDLDKAPDFIKSAAAYEPKVA
jgi:5S rRNA maturation endonuclease (ribonuclease M5)